MSFVFCLKQQRTSGLKYKILKTKLKQLEFFPGAASFGVFLGKSSAPFYIVAKIRYLFTRKNPLCPLKQY